MRNIKIITLILATLMIVILVLAGCAQSEPAPAPSPAPAPAPTPAPAPKEVIQLKFSYWPPPADIWVQRGILPWGPELEKKTNGRVKVTYYGGSSLGAPPDHLDLIMKGTADVGWMNPAFTPSVFPLTDIRNLPFLYPTPQVAAKVFWKQQEILNPLEYNDKVKVLFTFPTPVMECSTRTKQVKTLEDLKGLKFGGTEAIDGETSEALGAVGVIMMEQDIYTGLERGMLDGRWQEYNGLVTWGTMDVTKYRTDNVRIFTHQNMVAMNLDKYNSLPDDIRAAIDEMSGFDMSAATGEIWAGCEVDSRKKVLEYDKKVGNPPPYVLPDAERARWVKAAEPVTDGWLHEMDGKGLGAQARDLLAKTRQWVEEYSK